MAAVADASPPTNESPAISGEISQITKQQQHFAKVEMLSKIPHRSSSKVQVKSTQPEPKKNSDPTPDVEVSRFKEQANGHLIENGVSGIKEEGEEEEEHDNPHDPLPEFDWAEFQDRYLDAMSQASEDEQVLRNEFSGLVDYFGIWATAASQYDDERSAKRIKTRRLFVQHAEESLEKKKEHYAQVVQAFQRAMALLEGS